MRLAYYYSIWKVVLDFVAIMLAFTLAYFLRQADFVTHFLQATKDYIDFSHYSWVALQLAVVFVLLGFVHNLYRFGLNYGLRRDFFNIVKSFLFWVFLILVYFFINRSFPFSRAVFLMSFVLSFGFVLLVRLKLEVYLKYFFKNFKKIDKVAFMNLQESEIADFKATYPYYKFLSKNFVFKNLLKKKASFDVLVSKDLANLDQIMSFCENHQKQLYFMPIASEDARNFNIPAFLVYNTTLISGWGRVLKRLFDVLASLLLLIILSPVFLLITVLIKLSSKGPVFFKYDESNKLVMRVKKNQKLFYMYKFRTMQHNSHMLRYTNLAEANLRKGTPLVKIQNDPRITKLGKFLRRFDLDELPQLWNVLIGDMSLVGPRPHLKEEVSKYAENHKFVFNVKPGITGLAQISGRSDLSFEKEVALDRYYIQKWSFWMDVWILLKTPWVVFRGHAEFRNLKK